MTMRFIFFWREERLTCSPYRIWPTVMEATLSKSTDKLCRSDRWMLSCGHGTRSEWGTASGCRMTVPSGSDNCHWSGSNQELGRQCLKWTSPGGQLDPGVVGSIRLKLSSRTSSPVWGMTSVFQAAVPLTYTDITTSSGKMTRDWGQGRRPPSQLRRFCQSVSIGCHSLMKAPTAA